MKFMILTSLEGRYARALFISSPHYDVILKALEQVCLFFEKNPSFYRLLCSVSLRKKNRFLMIESLIQQLNIAKEIENFLKLLVQRNRLNVLKNIKNIYQDLVDQVMKRCHLIIESPHTLTSEEKEKLENLLTKYFQKKIIAHYILCPHLIGGFALKNKKKYWDASFRAQLRKLQSTLTNAFRLD